jgi:hypothetical protein
MHMGCRRAIGAAGRAGMRFVICDVGCGQRLDRRKRVGVRGDAMKAASTSRSVNVECCACG